MDLGLSGRACAVTGGGSGIGLETARQLSAEGARVLLVGRDPERLERAAGICSEAGADAGGTAAILAEDVTAEGAGERIVCSATQNFGRLDVLVNGAGSASWRDLDDVPEADFRKQFELSVMAPLAAMRAAIPAMAERGWGRVVNVSSTAGKRPSASMPDYSVAKAAELSLSRLFADRHASSGVLVNAICPGPTSSGIWVAPGGLADQSAAAGDARSREHALEATGAKRPIGRLAEPAEIASAIVFLCSERASYVAGAAWGVDGGTVQIIV